MSEQLKGSCLCGAVAYEAGPLTGPYGHCHCRTCQKAHAAAFVTTGPIAYDTFKWTKGGDTVAFFESSPGKHRNFCPKCGTHLMTEYTEEKRRILRIASLDTPLTSKPAGHIWVSDQAWYFDFDDDLPKIPKGTPE